MRCQAKGPVMFFGERPPNFCLIFTALLVESSDLNDWKRLMEAAPSKAKVVRPPGTALSSFRAYAYCNA